jgi:branched-chain amino acid transport system ATP-binding protein
VKLLEVKDIHTYYGDSHVLQGVSLDVAQGTLVAVAGRNGMGKTTLIHSVIGFNPPRRGSILYDNQDITRWKPFQVARLGIGLVPQGRRIFPSLTPKETIAIAARGSGSLWTLDHLLSIFPQLERRLHSRGKTLSGREQQMLSISRALAGRPKLILMDEPSEGLAPLIIQQIGRIIREIKAQGISIVLVEQNLSFALDLAEHVYIMSKGTIVYESTPQALKQDREVKSRYLGI